MELTLRAKRIESQLKQPDQLLIPRVADDKKGRRGGKSATPEKGRRGGKASIVAAGDGRVEPGYSKGKTRRGAGATRFAGKGASVRGAMVTDERSNRHKKEERSRSKRQKKVNDRKTK